MLSFALTFSACCASCFSMGLSSTFWPRSALEMMLRALVTFASRWEMKTGFSRRDFFQPSTCGMLSGESFAGSPSSFIFTAEANSTTSRSRLLRASEGSRIPSISVPGRSILPG